MVVLTLALVATGGWSWIDRPVPAVEEGNRSFARGLFAEAAAAYEQALVEGAEPELLLNRGLALYRMGIASSGGEAAETLRRAESALSRVANGKRPWLQARALTGLGNLYMHQKKFGDAIAAYRRALTGDPKNDVARHNLELALRRRLEDEQAGEDESGQGTSGAQEGGAEGAAAGEPGQKDEPEPGDAADGTGAGQGPDGPDEPAPNNNPEVEVANPDATNPGGGTESRPEPPRTAEVSDLSRKLEALERRSHNLRRRLLGKRKPAAQTEQPW